MKEIIITEETIRKESGDSENIVQLKLKLVDFINGKIDIAEQQFETTAKADYACGVAKNFLEKHFSLEYLKVCRRQQSVVVCEEGCEPKVNKPNLVRSNDFRDLVQQFRDGKIDKVEYQCPTINIRKKRMEIAKDMLAGTEFTIYSRKNKIYIEVGE